MTCVLPYHQAENPHQNDVHQHFDIDDDFPPAADGRGLRHLKNWLLSRSTSCWPSDGLDEDMVEELRKRAKDALTTKALAKKNPLKASNLRRTAQFSGLGREMAYARRSVVSAPWKIWQSKVSMTLPTSKS